MTPSVEQAKTPPSSGLGVDKFGGPVVDPTANVIALTEAANKRQDDLREAQDLLNAEKIRAIKEIVDLRAAHTQETSMLRAEHAKELNAMESNRLNAIRQVDVTAVQTEAQRALSAIQTLAAQTATNAETLRTALVNTASTIAVSSAGTVSGLSERIAALEKSTYEGMGKQRVADPMLAEMVEELKSLRESRAGTSGKSEGFSSSWLILLGAVSFISTLIAIGSAVMAFLRK
jgi:hypothetical protein